MEIRQLEHFLAVVRGGGFTAAARDVHIVQSALSASIRKLENELGTPLFERTTRRVVLTEAGQALLPVAGRILADVEAARGEVAAVAGLARGRVAVGTVQTLTVVDLPGALGRFRQNYPGVRVHVRDGMVPDLIAAVASGELDLSFVAVEAVLPEDVVSFRRWDQRLGLLTHPGHRLARRRRVRLAELDDEPFVVFSGSGLHSILERRFADAGIRYNQVCETPHIPLLIDLVAAGLGVSIVPEDIAERSGLPCARIEQPSLRRHVHLIGRSAVPANPAARALLAQLTG
ncbi:LysR family transcriptional regulator [Amycolatopsis suaedae]|uniref:LysR family transcriptional regulator n=1 Tax=Amycolatopsis suaedae TaxID=2510978 RepID=A0A4V2EMD2_9PSEU|nr:LysR family transcriptional regulator [Amycolatopsis suaedae]RZQ64655.1 LysR family transcriptional regulator [Amycolatopsis suaedae]